MMEQFRKLGVVVEVEEGELVNRQAMNMCTAGEPISPEGAKLLVSALRAGLFLFFRVGYIPIACLVSTHRKYYDKPSRSRVSRHPRWDVPDCCKLL